MTTHVGETDLKVVRDIQGLNSDISLSEHRKALESTLSLTTSTFFSRKGNKAEEGKKKRKKDGVQLR